MLLAAALFLGLLAAAPALSGVGYTRVIHFLTGEPPKEVVEDLARLDQGAPSGMEQHPIVGKTGKVYERRTEYGIVRIWLTPTKKGGFCQNIELPDRSGRTRSAIGGCFPAALRMPLEVGGSGGGTDFAAGWITGRVAPSVSRLEVRYVNGETQPAELQNGFFVVPVDELRAKRGTDHPAELIGRGSAGEIVAREDVSLFYSDQMALAERPPVADVAKERPLIDLPLSGGATATLHLSPSRAGGWCARVADARRRLGLDLCADPAELAHPIRFGLKRVATRTEPRPSSPGPPRLSAWRPGRVPRPGWRGGARPARRAALPRQRARAALAAGPQTRRDRRPRRRQTGPPDSDGDRGRRLLRRTR